MAAIKDIINFLGPINYDGKKILEIKGFEALVNYSENPEILTWCNEKYVHRILEFSSGTILLSVDSYSFVKSNHQGYRNLNWIVVERPKFAFVSILRRFFSSNRELGSIAKSAEIHESVAYDSKSVNIGSNVIIEKGVVLGKGVEIGHNTVILENTKIGNQVIIGSNCTIGGVGFGYEKDEDGNYIFNPHFGDVVIKDKVEIGNNTCIDRAVMGSTIIGENVKIDNLVHIAHGVVIGRNSLIIANAMIAGSVKIGENVWIAPSVATMQHISIADNSLIGLGSVVLKNVDSNTVMVGNPAKPITKK